MADTSMEFGQGRQPALKCPVTGFELIHEMAPLKALAQLRHLHDMGWTLTE